MGEGDISGAEGATDMAGAPAADAGAPMESNFSKKPLLIDSRESQTILEHFVKKLIEKDNDKNEKVKGRVDISNENLMINEETQSLLEGLERKLDEIETEFGEL
jgi:hypothetical protein